MAEESIFDSDLKTSFDNADLCAALMRIDRSLFVMNLTLAFGCGVLMYMAANK